MFDKFAQMLRTVTTNNELAVVANAIVAAYHNCEISNDEYIELVGLQNDVAYRL